jgi:hypothetical protein
VREDLALPTRTLVRALLALKVLATASAHNFCFTLSAFLQTRSRAARNANWHPVQIP